MRTRQSQSRPAYLCDADELRQAKLLVISAIIVAAVVIFLLVFVERIILQKALVKLVQPVGFICLSLLGVTVRSWYRRKVWTTRLLASLWHGYTLVRNTIGDNALIRTLENRFSNVDPFELDPLDTVVVLGGGTAATKGRDLQFAPSGDRVGSAARLYHAG